MTFRDLSDAWKFFALRGAMAIIFGVVSWVWPELSLAVLVALFGAFALVDGTLCLIAGIREKRSDEKWPLIVVGAAGLIAGIATFFWPDLTALALLYVIATWAIVIGAVQLYIAVRYRHMLQNELMLAAGGIAGIAFGILAIAFPGAGAVSLVWLIGTFAILFGVTQLALGLRLRSLQEPRRDAGGGRQAMAGR